MAHYVDFPERNDTLRARPGTEDRVGDLPVFRQGLSFLPDGRRLDPCLISCWEFSAEEVAEIVRTGRVYFQAWGGMHPPISVHGTSPFSMVDHGGQS